MVNIFGEVNANKRRFAVLTRHIIRNKENHMQCDCATAVTGFIAYMRIYYIFFIYCIHHLCHTVALIGEMVIYDKHRGKGAY